MVVIHPVGARAVVAFPARRIVVIVAGVVVGQTMLLAVAGEIAVNIPGTSVVTVADITVVAAAVIITITAEARGIAADADDAGVAAGVGWRRDVAGRRTRVQREKVLLQPHAHRGIRGIRVVTQAQCVVALFGLPDVGPQLLGGAVLLRLVPTDGRIH